MRVHGLMVCVAMLAVLTACGSDSEDDAAPAPNVTATAKQPALPDGWRWESYRDLAVGVPGNWGYGGYGRWSAWCADGISREAAIGRPGGVLGIACGDPKQGGVDPGSLVDNTGTFVAFALEQDLELPEEGDRSIVRAGTGGVIIQAPAALREKIARTVHVLTGVDFHDCPLNHPIIANAAYRPAAFDGGSVAGTDSISVCKYPLPGRGFVPASGAALISSLRVTGADAGRAVAAILAAPAGGGPNRTNPKTCSLESGYGDEAYVVRIQREARDPAEIVVHYSGCTHNGFDDGRTIRTLTAEGMAWLVAEPNTPRGFIGDRGMPGLMARARALAQQHAAS